MFGAAKCKREGCQKPAVSLIEDNKIVRPEGDFCFEHSPDPGALHAAALRYIETHDRIVGLSACGIELAKCDLAGKQFFGCNFQHSTFSGVRSEGLRMRLCIMDFSTFTDCSLINSNIQLCSFAGSKLAHVLFTGSDLIQNNFNGVTAEQCSFDDSDLYSSRFIKASLINTSMMNCNLKRVIFYESTREQVSFKLSNIKESFITREGPAAVNELKREEDTL